MTLLHFMQSIYKYRISPKANHLVATTTTNNDKVRVAVKNSMKIEKPILQVSIIFRWFLAYAFSPQNEKQHGEREKLDCLKCTRLNESQFDPKWCHSRLNNSHFNLFDVCVSQVWFTLELLRARKKDTPYPALDFISYLLGAFVNELHLTSSCQSSYSKCQ